jgi:hypothetical protein
MRFTLAKIIIPMQNAQQSGPLDGLKRLYLIGRLIRISTILLLTVAVLMSGNKFVALGIAVVGYLVLVAVLNLITRKKMQSIAIKHPEFGGIMNAMMAPGLSEGDDDDDDEKDAIDDQFGLEDPRLEKWSSTLPSDYPAPQFDHESEYQPVVDDSPIQDTLYEDTTGHGADMEDGIMSDGLMPCLHFIACSTDDWVMTPWGLEVTLSIEAIAACAGAPSRDQGLARIRQWGSGVDYDPPEELVKEMISKIDFILSSYQANPTKHDLNPESIEDVLAAGQRMRDRISMLLP